MRRFALSVSATLALFLVACGDEVVGGADLSTVPAEVCTCSHEWEWDDGSFESETYTETFYCDEPESEVEDWIETEVEDCADSYLDSAAYDCDCDCVPTGNC